MRRKRERQRDMWISESAALFLFSRLVLSINLKRYLSWAPRLVLTSYHTPPPRRLIELLAPMNNLSWRLPPLLLVAMKVVRGRRLVRHTDMSLLSYSFASGHEHPQWAVHYCCSVPAPSCGRGISSCWLHDYFTISVQVMRCACSVFSYSYTRHASLPSDGHARV